MYRKAHSSQNSPEEFELPFSGRLSPNNRWVILAELIPWEEFEAEYAKYFSSEKGAPAKVFRMALGSLIIAILGLVRYAEKEKKQIRMKYPCNLIQLIFGKKSLKYVRKKEFPSENSLNVFVSPRALFKNCLNNMKKPAI
jgi:hypothetical protein